MSGTRAPRIRLDLLVVERGLASSVEDAQRIILAGEIRSGDTILTKSGQSVRADIPLQARIAPPFVSRGGEKLGHAIHHFQIAVDGLVCADIGAATGGFTDALLKEGAARVYAVDVGYGDLAYELRINPRVTLLERTNARLLEKLPEPVDFVAIDVSFTSVTPILAKVPGWVTPTASVVVLVKPQFEARANEVERGGIVRAPAVHRRVIEEVARAGAMLQLNPCGLTGSPIFGRFGNREFLLHLRRDDGSTRPSPTPFDLEHTLTALGL